MILLGCIHFAKKRCFYSRTGYINIFVSELKVINIIEKKMYPFS